MTRTTIVLACALLVCTTAAGLVWAEDLHVRNQVAQFGVDLESARAELQGRLAAAANSMEVMAQARIAVRLDYDPAVTSAVADVTATAADAACMQARDAIQAGHDPPPIETTVQAATTEAEGTYPALSEVSGWQTHVDTAAIAAKAAECKQAAEAAKKSSQKASETKKKKARTPPQCPKSDPACSESYGGDYSCGDTKRVMEDANKGIPVNCYD